MKAMKKIVKVEEPKFILNYTNCETPDDLRYNLIIAKVRGGQPITEEDLDFIVNDAIGFAMASVSAAIVACYEYKKPKEAKKPWYKRLWNWLTGRK